MAKAGSKQTEVGIIPEDWGTTKFSVAVQINPKRELRKHIINKKISMDDLAPFTKGIHHYGIAEFKGGSKFQNGDTLMARITPCLENGKIAYVDILSDGEVGHGSTEFIVLSGKPGKTTNDFVYYLAISPSVRREAIQSMTGTSGRQRVQLDSLGQIEVALPPLSEQQRIAKILSDIDSKIELNQQMSKTLEAMAKVIFKHWFIDFEFPTEEGKPYKSSGGEMVYNEVIRGEIPSDWQCRKLPEISVNHDSKRIPLSSRERDSRNGIYPYYGATGVVDYVDDFLFDGVYVLMGEDGSVIDDDGYPVLQYVWGKFWVNNHAHVLSGKSISNEMLYLILKNTKVNHIVTGAVQPKINQGNMNNLTFAIPDQSTLSLIQHFLASSFARYRSNHAQMETLTRMRDSLLPKLMSGKIRVPAEVK